MKITVTINNQLLERDVAPDLMLIDFLRENGYLSVKRGCETTNCGLCTVHLDGQSVLSCSVLAVRAHEKSITTLEGLQKEAEAIGDFIAKEGADQCGYCSPGLIMNIISMERDFLKDNRNEIDAQEIKTYLAGNLCRCTGYMGHLRAIANYLRTKGVKITGSLPENTALEPDKALRSVVKSPIKKDSKALTSGKPVYTDDLAPKNALIVKLLPSPYASALIESIDTSKALALPGIACVLTYKDVPNKRFTTACQAYPEPSLYDRLILENRLRYVGDPVAIVAGENEKVVEKALKLIKVNYQVLTPVLDVNTSKDNKILVHPEEDTVGHNDFFPSDIKRNLVFSGSEEHGNVEAELKGCDYVIERTYHTLQNSQTAMEPFTTFTNLDPYGRLVITSSTQTPFHIRRIIANALDIPKSQVKVIKPRIGGGFGSKQTSVSEMYPAIVTLKTGRPAKIFYTRKECFEIGSPRHEMKITVKIGATKDGKIKAIDLYTLSNTGAYNEHGSCTVGLSGTKSLSLYGRIPAQKFSFDVVYTNKVSSGAYRGFGATQGIFAVESAIDELAKEMSIAPDVLRENNMLTLGGGVPMYYNEPINSSSLDKCLEKAKTLINWEEKYPAKEINGKIRAVGLSMAMQGSGITGIDAASAEVKLTDHGKYLLNLGAADIGTGADTILAQIAAETLMCDIEDIVVSSLSGVDTDIAPYDAGAYASSTTYITGMAVFKSCEALLAHMVGQAAKKMEVKEAEVDFDGKSFIAKTPEGEKQLSLFELGYESGGGSIEVMNASKSHSSPVSPPPFMVGAVEIELDPNTGKVEILDYVGVLDCGTPINPNLVRIQAEGGIAQGIGMALYEDVRYDKNGKMLNNTFMTYKIPTRLDLGTVRVYIEPSYEPTGPFGAKSAGEIVINNPSPAIANALANAGVRLRSLPMTPEKILAELKKNK